MAGSARYTCRRYVYVRAVCRAVLAVGHAPFALETRVPVVFAAGDVRLDPMKRIASAVGEDAMSVYFMHRYLATV